MRLLIVHNTLWAHYKSLLFKKIADQLTADDDLLVLQIALTESHREGLGVPDASTVGYPFRLLHNGALESVSLPRRISGLLTHGLAFKPDVLLLTGYYDPAQLLLGIVLKIRGCRVILQNESTALDSPRTGWREQIKRAFVRMCDGFFCFGTRAADYLVQLGAMPEQILVRNNAVVDNAFLREVYDEALPTRQAVQQTLQLPPNNLMYVGRLLAIKNLAALIDAFAEACRANPSANWGLILLGEGDQKTALQQQAGTLGIANRISFLPGCNWQEVPRFLTLADVFVLPSQLEPWGLVVNEAMACGLPVLVSDRCGCVADLVQEGQNGYRFDPNQPRQLSDKIGRFFAMSGAERAAMGLRSAQLVDVFNPDAVGKAMYDALTHLSQS
ncbi:glycosyltransferase family 4 protein [Fibrella forsythiae]|uniref:Glycosyltransferase family 4 protein n=1 Tax=Fibrella forsythiae TaxID=2817061 RepID=A0ABS3JQX4_9BACT|nr:glycosyltransferase family 4 protein [Fibrella forsythiae]MBO0952410.1 glycosyltransferase family 4 protein [Fibrella forsythiae]